MVKYRIIKEEGKFYPQYKKWFFWKSCRYRDGGIFDKNKPAVFYDINDAIAAVKRLIETKKETIRPKKEVVWTNYGRN